MLKYLKQTSIFRYSKNYGGLTHETRIKDAVNMGDLICLLATVRTLKSQKYCENQNCWGNIIKVFTAYFQWYWKSPPLWAKPFGHELFTRGQLPATISGCKGMVFPCGRQGSYKAYTGLHSFKDYLKRHWTTSASSPDFFPKKLRFLY